MRLLRLISLPFTLLLVGLQSCLGQSPETPGDTIAVEAPSIPEPGKSTILHGTVHKTSYYEVTYPSNWTIDKLEDFSSNVAFRMFPPPYRIVDGNYVYVYPKSNDSSPIIYKAMMPTLANFRIKGGERSLEWTTCKSIEMAGLKGFMIERDFEGVSIQNEYYLEYDESTVIIIAVKAKMDVYKKFQADFEAILNSIKGIPSTKPATSKREVEISTASIQQDWIEKKTTYPYSSMVNSNITRFDSLLLAFMEGNFAIKIKETGQVISNWETLFKWKSASALKDFQIFSQYDFCSAQLDIFQKNIHLGEYEKLIINDLENNKLQFDFLDNGNRIVRWELEYNGEHTLPIGEEINLEHFLFVTQEGYRRPSDGKIGYDIPFLINNKLYRVKTANVKVY